MALQLLAEYDFTNAANTNFGPSGSTSGSSGAIIDVSGNGCRIEGGGGGNGRLVLYHHASLNRSFRRPSGEAYSHAAIEVELDLFESSVAVSGGTIYFSMDFGWEDPPNENEHYNQRWPLTQPSGTGSKFNTVRRSPASTILGDNYAGAYPSGASVLYRSERLSAGPTTWSWRVESPIGSVWKSGSGGNDNESGWQHPGRSGLTVPPYGAGSEYFKIKRIRFYGEATTPALAAGIVNQAVFDDDSATITVNAPTGGVPPYTARLLSGDFPDDLGAALYTTEQSVTGLTSGSFPLVFNPIALSPGEVRYFWVRFEDSSGGTATRTNPIAATTTTGLDLSDFITDAEAYASPLPFTSDIIAFAGSSSMAGGSATGETVNTPSDASAPLKMAELLEEGGWVEDVTVVNGGFPTTTTATWLPNAAGSPNRLETLRQAIAATSGRPRLLYFYIGTNDAGLASGVGPSTWEANYKTILEYILTNASWADQRPTAGIVIMQLHYVNNLSGSWDGIFNPTQQADMVRMNDRLPDIAAYINDLSSVQNAGDARVYVGHPDEYRSYIYRWQNRLRVGDFLHPQVPEGYEVMARLMQIRYLELLSGAGPTEGSIRLAGLSPFTARVLNATPLSGGPYAYTWEIGPSGGSLSATSNVRRTGAGAVFIHLSPETNYEVRRVATDGDSNVQYSPRLGFRTLPDTEVQRPPLPPAFLGRRPVNRG